MAIVTKQLEAIVVITGEKTTKIKYNRKFLKTCDLLLDSEVLLRSLEVLLRSLGGVCGNFSDETVVHRVILPILQSFNFERYSGVLKLPMNFQGVDYSERKGALDPTSCILDKEKLSKLLEIYKKQPYKNNKVITAIDLLDEYDIIGWWINSGITITTHSIIAPIKDPEIDLTMHMLLPDSIFMSNDTIKQIFIDSAIEGEKNMNIDTIRRYNKGEIKYKKWNQSADTLRIIKQLSAY